MPTAGVLASFGRFLATGAANTAITYSLYLALLRFEVPYAWAYSMAYVAGIGFAYVMYRYVVFQYQPGRFGPLWVACVYGLQYLFGLGLVHVWVVWFGWGAVFAPLFALMVSVPLSFACNRWVFRPRHPRPSA